MFPVRSLGHVMSTWLTIRPRSAGHTWAGLGENLQVASGEYLGKGLCSGVRWPWEGDGSLWHKAPAPWPHRVSVVTGGCEPGVDLRARAAAFVWPLVLCPWNVCRARRGLSEHRVGLGLSSVPWVLRGSSLSLVFQAWLPLSFLPTPLFRIEFADVPEALLSGPFHSVWTDRLLPGYRPPTSQSVKWQCSAALKSCPSPLAIRLLAGSP